MKFSEIIEVLFTLREEGAKDLARPFSEALLHPHRAYPTIHVAGTNGKGSVCHKIAKALSLSGYRVGLYTSPHIHSYCERIAINEVPISESRVVEGLQTLFELSQRESWRPGFFLFTTFLAFEYFRQEKVDVAVIETGIGGRYDATNIILPILSVITSIGKDHEALLGEGVENIAREKAGIIKKNIPVVVGPRARLDPIFQEAKSVGAPLHLVCERGGFYDDENRAVAQEALRHLHKSFNLSESAVHQGLSERPFFRFMKKGRVLFDVAHNGHGFQRLFEGLRIFYPQEKYRFVFGAKADKDYREILKEMSDYASHIHLVECPTAGKAPLEELEKSLLACSYCAYSLYFSVEDALKDALAYPELIVVCGSFSLMHPAALFLSV